MAVQLRQSQRERTCAMALEILQVITAAVVVGTETERMV